MDELSAIRIFSKVAEAGSLSIVSRQLGMSPSSISRQISNLESELGVRLIHRTTRQLALTETGQKYYEDISIALKSFEDAKRGATSCQEGIRGRISMHCATSAGSDVIIPALPDFLAKHPDLDIDITLTDERVSLVAENVDLAIWLGNLADSSMVGRLLSPSRRALVASYDYLSRHGLPTDPKELLKHNCLSFNQSHYQKEWSFRKNGQTVRIPISGNLSSNNAMVLKAATVRGLGLALLQDWMVRDSCAKGLLQKVLPEYEITPTNYDTSLYLVYPHRRQPSKVRALIDFLVPLFARSD